MGTTNRAEELAKKYANIKHDRPIDQEERYFKDYQKYDGFIAGFNSRQSEIDEWKFVVEEYKKKYLSKCDEIDELTNEAEVLNSAVDNLMKSRHELQDEVERLRKEREWISVYRSDIQIPIDTPILCKQKAKCSNFTYLILGMDKNGEFRDFNNEDYIGTTESELYAPGNFPKIEFWQPLPSINH